MKRVFFSVLTALAALAAFEARALEILAPHGDSVVKEGRVVVIGKSSAPKGKAVYNGQSTSFRVKDGYWSVALNLKPGTHEVAFEAGGEEVRVRWTVDPEAVKGFYRYHPGVEAEKCANCHEGGYALTGDDSVAPLCNRCHKAFDKEEFVHGPVAFGQCAVCHDAHGSARANALRLPPVELCQDCHNQPVSKKHRDEAGEEVCTECHNPHSSAKPFMLR